MNGKALAINIEANIDAQVLNNQKDGVLKVATFAGFPTVYNSNIQVNMNVHGDSYLVTSLTLSSRPLHFNRLHLKKWMHIKATTKR